MPHRFALPGQVNFPSPRFWWTTFVFDSEGVVILRILLGIGALINSRTYQFWMRCRDVTRSGIFSRLRQKQRRSDVASMAAKWSLDSEGVRYLAAIFWRGRQTTSPIPAYRASHQVRGASARQRGHVLRSAKTLMSSRPKDLTPLVGFRTNDWPRLTSTA